MTSLKFKIQIFQYFWVRQLAYQQHYVGSGYSPMSGVRNDNIHHLGSGLQNINVSLLVMGTDKENTTWSNKISGN